MHSSNEMSYSETKEDSLSEFMLANILEILFRNPFLSDHVAMKTPPNTENIGTHPSTKPIACPETILWFTIVTRPKVFVLTRMIK